MVMDTRPMYVEEWLDTLPYIDFNKTAALIEQALAATNSQDVKPGTRQALNTLYHRPYQYYLESQIKTGAQHTLSTIGAMQAQIRVMKKIASHLAYSSKLTFDNISQHKSIWKANKIPYDALLMSMHYLSHALLFNYLEYSPTPKNVWQQLHAIYDLAESSQVQGKTITLPGSESKPVVSSFAETYKRILMTSLVDPHHLPFGAIWEIYEQMKEWSQHVRLQAMQDVDDATGKFILDLTSDQKPVPFVKSQSGKTTDTMRLLDASELVALVNKHVASAQQGKLQNTGLALSPFYLKQVLSLMSSSWGTPATRSTERSAVKGQVKVCAGLENVYYHMNGKQPFESPLSHENDEEIDVNSVTGGGEGSRTRRYLSEVWRVVDQSSGGFALIRQEKPDKNVRVGQLVAIAVGEQQDKYILGIIRWMMISKDVHKIGVEKLSRRARNIALRARDGSATDRSYRPAFLMENSDKVLLIVTEKGLYSCNRDLIAYNRDKENHIVADKLIESGVACELFSFKEG